jgi:hypothetical protein
VQHLWLATADRGLAAWLYGASEVTACVGAEGVEVTVVEETDYPFAGAIRLSVRTETPVSFPLYLRLPGWVRGGALRVNGEDLAAEFAPGQYLRLERTWEAGDLVELELGMALEVQRWPRTGSVSVDRGPLTYSLKIEERWESRAGSPDFPDWEVFPTTPWNYGLVLEGEDSTGALRLGEQRAVADQPWTVAAAPLEIVASARRLPAWTLRPDQTIMNLQPSPIRSEEPLEEVTLIPLGCARLRLACFPVIGEGPDARAWEPYDAAGEPGSGNFPLDSA